MWYINSNPSESGNYGNPQSNQFADSVALPNELLPDYLACYGFASLTMEDEIITAITTNVDALNAYLASLPEPEPQPEPEPTIADRMTAVEEAVEILLSGRTE